MKKLILRFSIFLIISFIVTSSVPTSALQTPNTSSFGQGLYALQDLNLQPNVKYNIMNESTTENMFIAIFTNDPQVSQSARIKAGETITLVKPIQFGYSIAIIGKGKLNFYV